MRRQITYSAKPPPKACVDPGDPWNEDWTYSAGEKGHIEVHDAEEGEHWEETGLVDLRGNPIWRITRYVRPHIGFIDPVSRA